jgi:hypothetical protein
MTFKRTLGRVTRDQSIGALAVATTLAALTAFEAADAAPAPTSPTPLATFTVDRSGTSPVNEYTWTVPRGVRTVTFDVFGASGGHPTPGGTHGLGGGAQATFSVAPGTVFHIVVGGRGGDTLTPVEQFPGGPLDVRYPGGLNGGGIGNGDGTLGGGGGGGASDIRAGACAAGRTCGHGDRIVVAGGGGGETYVCPSSTTCSHLAGGGGGGSTGDAGGGWPGARNGGTQSEAGGLFALGFGSGERCNLAGGGGGWFGGGCGAASDVETAYGAGGGSGHVDPLALASSIRNGVRDGDGLVVIYKG